MTEDLEERFRAACAAYLGAAEEVDYRQAAAEAADRATESAMLAADGARDELLQVVRERDLQARLGAGETVVYPSPRAADDPHDDAEFIATAPPLGAYRPPAAGSQRWHDMISAGTCPECGVSWGLVSKDCPKRVFNRHILG